MADTGTRVFGVFHIPIVLAFFILNFAVIAQPPTFIGAFLVPYIVQLTQACDSIVHQVTQQVYDESSVSLWAVIPLSMLMLVIRRVFQPLVEKTIKRFVFKDEDAFKFSESLYRCIYYALMFFSCVYIISLEDYWPDVRQCWTGVRSRTQPRPIELQSYYVLELSYYVSGTFAHVFLEQKLKDFWVMFSHHILTVCLLFFSYLAFYHRIGMLVLYVHDISDIFLESAKCLKYLKYELWSNSTFIALIVSWAYYRLYIFPFYVIESPIWSGQQYAFEMEGEYIPYYEIFVVWLGLLQVLHVYWFYLMIKVAIRSITTGDIQDVRDEDAIAQGDKEINKTKSE